MDENVIANVPLSAISTKKVNIVKIFAYSGYMFFLASFICLFYLVIYVNKMESLKDLGQISSDEIIFILVNHYSTPAFLLLASIFSLLAGYVLMKFVVSSSKKVIPDEDRGLLEEIIKIDEDEPIKRYIKLSSLTGWVGLFTKIGLNGLPLATIALTLIFATLSFFEFESANFIDFTKLTLGAFLGSYVQRNLGQGITKIGSNGIATEDV